MEAILGSIAAIVLSMFGVVGFTQFADMGIKNVQTAAASTQMQIFDKAMTQYVADNGATIAQSATATNPITITPAQLIAGGYLPAGYTASNPFGQKWQAQVLQPTAGQLETLVTSNGGAAITDTKQLAQIAAQAGAQGGFVPYANQAGDSFNTSNAYGTYGGWSVPLTSFSNPGSGHLASLLAFTDVTANTQYLYRVQVPNHPELNNMQVDLGMTDTAGNAHNINGANTINGVTGKFSGSVATNGINPTDISSGWGGGIRTNDVVANGTVAVGATSSTSATAYLSNSLCAGCVYAQSGQIVGNLSANRIGVDGYSPDSGYPAGIAGGIHTWDIYSEGAMYVGRAGSKNGDFSSAGVVDAKIFNAAALATPEQPCTTQINNGDGTNIVPKAGSLALNADGSGQMLICKNDPNPSNANGLIWIPTGGRWEAVFQQVVSNGTTVPAPKCSNGGTGKLLLNAQNMQVNSTGSTAANGTVNSVGGVQYGPAAPTGGSGPWTVSIQDGNGNPLPASTQAMATVYCEY